MKTRIIGMMVTVGFAVGFGAACETGQPPASCPIPQLTAFAVYQVAEADAAKACGNLTGEFWGLSKYNTPGTDVNTLAVKPEQMGNFTGDSRLDVAGNTALNAIGGFDTEANAQGFCAAHDMAPASINVPEVTETLADGGTDVTPAANVSYNITSLEFVGTAHVPGTQFRGEMDYTADGCTAHYKILGIAPWVACDNGSGQPDDTLCNTTTLPDGGLGVACSPDTGECLNPDFAVKCDPVNLVCIPSQELPSLKQ